MDPRRSRRTALALVALALAAGLLAARPAGARPPDADWRTLETPHFRVHYPAPAEAWARRAAARLEEVRERVIGEIGYAPPQVADVLVVDPLARPNGQALPLLGRPRMILFTTAPEPGSVIGHYRDWGELLLVHEEAHLVHMLRPSRNAWQRTLSRALPFGPITRRAPRWLFEGYATLLEGRLTGTGRPYGDLRAAVLRQRALAGRLPAYGALAGGDDSWLGPSMAYLAGSAFLEWLESEAYPPAGADLGGAASVVDEEGAGAAPPNDPLPALWARMTARRDRGFDDAFEGVFGMAPAAAWGRFTAQLSWRAVEVARALEGTLAEGELVQDLAGRTGAPAVSPDGSRLALVLRPPGGDQPPRLVVWPTTSDPEAARRRAEERRRLVERDPEDVPAIGGAPPAAEPLAVLPTIDGAPPAEPRWLRDGRALLLVRDLPDGRGLLHPDLFLWHPDDGRLVRLTRQADLRSPDPAPDGGWAVAVRSRDGASQLVRVDLESGAVRALTPPSVERVWASPRLAPDGERLAALVHRDGRWRLVVRELDGVGGATAERELALPAAASPSSFAWAPDGEALHVALGEGGFVDLWRVAAAPGAPESSPERLTRTLGGALAPAPLPDGSGLFFLGLDHDGLDLRRLELPPPAEPLPAPAAAELADLAGLAPAVAPRAAGPPPPPPAEAELGADRPYGAGPQALQWLGGLAAQTGAWAGEVGLAGGDPAGRLSWLAAGSLGGDGAVRGAVATAAWRGWPVEVSVALYDVQEEPSAGDAAVSPAAGLDVERRGLVAGAGLARRRGSGGWRLGLDLAVGEVAPLAPDLREGGGDAVDTAGATLGGRLWDRSSRGRWSWPLDLEARWQEGETDGDGWRRRGIAAGAALLHGGRGVGAAWGRHDSAGVERPFDRYRLGGLARSVLPAAADLGRLPHGAWPAAVAVGDEVEHQRLELYLDGRSKPLFWERHRLTGEGGDRPGEWLELAGFELRATLGPTSILPLPGVEVTAGAALVLAGPGEDDVRGWLGLAWRP